MDHSGRHTGLQENIMKDNHLIRLFTDRMYYPRLKLLENYGNPVLIWNMGKVASTSIARSLWRQIGRYNVLTTHFMNQAEHSRSRLLYEVLIKGSCKPLPIIALTREPIGKNISSFFQNFERNVGAPFEHYENRVSELCEFFIHRFDKHDTIINWFDQNIKEYIGLDVYDHQFDPSKGYCIIEHGRFKVLVLRSEESDKIKEAAVKELLGLTEFRLENENVGADKPYSDLYREFQAALNLPDSYLDSMLNCRYTRHFYSASEIEQINSKWRKLR